MRENKGALLNQPVKAGCVKQAVFLRPPAFQAGCHEPSFYLLPLIVFVIILGDRSCHEQ
jgi:hypothetical protein